VPAAGGGEMRDGSDEGLLLLGKGEGRGADRAGSHTNPTIRKRTGDHCS